MKTQSLFAGTLLLITLPGASLAQTEFQNGTFDSPGLPLGQPATGLFSPGSTFITGWTTVVGYNGTWNQSVEYFSDRSQDPGGYCVELGYYFGVNAIQQRFITLANQPYLVSFWLATDAYNGPPAVLRVSAGGTTTDFQAPPGSGDHHSMGWQPESFLFTSDSTVFSTLWFGNVVGIPAIDTITLTPVPEPGTYALLGIAVCMMILAARRRGKAVRTSRAQH